MRFTNSIGRVAMLATAGVALAACGGGGGGGGGPPTNLVPTAAFTATPEKGLVSLAVAVDGAGSSDRDDTITGYRWSFGDGATASGVTAVHTYTKPGRFQIELTVTDSKGAVDSVKHAVVSMSPVAATSYQVTEIPSLGGWYTEPRKISNAGEVTGFSHVAATGQAHAFLYSDGTIRDLGTLGGAASYGNDINDSGNVVGHSLTATGADRAFCYCNGLMRELPTLGGSYGHAYAINSAGTIVGQSDDANGTYLGFIYRSGWASAISTLGGNYGDANAVNDAGHVAGRSTMAVGAMHAYLLQGSTMVDLAAGTSGRDFTVYGMNDADDVVGMWIPGTGTSTSPTGFLYRDGVPSEITAGYHEPIDVNNAGVVVGSAQFGNDNHAFVWDETRGMQDLNTLIDPGTGLTLVVVQGISDAGQIVGHGNRVPSGAQVAVLLTPIW
jgi:probable HAF family extracellular repeat protein